MQITKTLVVGDLSGLRESAVVVSPDDQVLNRWALGNVASVSSTDQMHLMIAKPMPFEIVLPKGLMVGSVEAYEPIYLREAPVAVATKMKIEEEDLLPVLMNESHLDIEMQSRLHELPHK